MHLSKRKTHVIPGCHRRICREPLTPVSFRDEQKNKHLETLRGVPLLAAKSPSRALGFSPTSKAIP